LFIILSFLIVFTRKCANIIIFAQIIVWLKNHRFYSNTCTGDWWLPKGNRWIMMKLSFEVLNEAFLFHLDKKWCRTLIFDLGAIFIPLVMMFVRYVLHYVVGDELHLVLRLMISHFRVPESDWSSRTTIVFKLINLCIN